METKDTTHFGFRTVAATEKSALVRGVFDSVARRYDLMNDLMSLGVHRLWKEALADRVAPTPGMHVLDLAGGTGDIALRLLDRGAGHVTLADINESMLTQGRSRLLDQGRVQRLSYLVADAEALPLRPRGVDAVTIAFGLRNVTRIDAALAEARRVLRPGGRFFCLEFSQVVLPLLDRLYETYSFEVLPRLGHWVARDAESYRYLAESIRRFPPQGHLAQRMRAAGLEQVTWRNLSGGIVALHVGWRL